MLSERSSIGLSSPGGRLSGGLPKRGQIETMKILITKAEAAVMLHSALSGVLVNLPARVGVSFVENCFDGSGAVEARLDWIQIDTDPQLGLDAHGAEIILVERHAETKPNA